MMAAAFGYSTNYVKWELSLMDVYGHIAYYNDNPPAGTLLLAIINAFTGKSEEKKAPSVMSSDLDQLMSDFASAGG